jgi:hypothetical protein
VTAESGTTENRRNAMMRRVRSDIDTSDSQQSNV